MSGTFSPAEHAPATPRRGGRLGRLAATFARPSALIAALGATPSALAQPSPTPGGAIRLDPVIVEGAPEAPAGPVEGYVPRRDTSATKTDTPIVETPQAVSVVTREQLDDRNAQDIKEGLNYTPGISTNVFGFDPRNDTAFSIRGFSAAYTGVFRDGLRDLNSGNALTFFRTEPYGLESIAVLRGPSSALYGQGSPGGIVDLRTKRPTAEPLREVAAQVGTDERYQGQFDVSGPIDEERRFRYRLTGLARDGETSLIATPDDRVYIAPAFTFAPGPDTTLTLLGEVQHSLTGGTVAFFNDPETPGNTTDLEWGDPEYNDNEQDQFRIGYALDHRVNDVFTVRQNLRYTRIDLDYRYTQIDSITPDGLFANRSTGHFVEDLDTFAIDNQVQAEFAAGTVGHTLLGGIDHTYANFRRRNGFGTAPPLNIADRNYGEQPIGDPEFTEASGIEQSQFGLYLQDQARLGDFTLTFGGRYDWLDTKSVDRVTDVDANQDDDEFTGRIGLTYVSDTGLAPYVSYSSSFAGTLGAAVDGTPFEPTSAEGAEVGVKYQPPDVNALVTLALFNIEQQNVPATDPVDVTNQIQIGEVRSRGVELEGVASLGSGFSVNAAYTYLDLEIEEGAPDQVGNFPSGIPRHQVSAWGNYEVPEGDALAGLNGGLGVRYVGESYGDEENNFKNDDFILFDAALGYDLGALRPQLEGLGFQLNGQNLLGEQYTTCQAGFCYRTEDRRVIAGLRYRW